MHLTEELILDRRACERAAVSSSITLRPIGGFNHEVALHDLSVAGCRIELVESAELGEPLITRFPHLEPMVGALRWSEGPTAGLQFMRRMHPAVFDHLLTRLP